jgi:hypothetical protein
MASETNIVITVDEEHDPPRWVRVSGLRLFQKTPWLGGAFGLALGLGLVAMTTVATRSNPNTVPLWAIGVAFGIFYLLAFFVFLFSLQRLKNSDIRTLRQATDNGLGAHREALLAGIYNQTQKRGASSKWFDVDEFVKPYAAYCLSNPLVLLVGNQTPMVIHDVLDSPQYIKGDPPISFRNSKLMMAITVIPPVIIAGMIANVLRSMNATPQQWLMFAPIFLMLLAQPFLYDLEIKLVFPRRNAIVDRGAVEFRKRFRRYSLTTADAICFVIAQKRKATVEWHRPGKRMPALTLHLHGHGPNDPRLQTILNLWTADPPPEPTT